MSNRSYTPTSEGGTQWLAGTSRLRPCRQHSNLSHSSDCEITTPWSRISHHAASLGHRDRDATNPSRGSPIACQRVSGAGKRLGFAPTLAGVHAWYGFWYGLRSETADFRSRRNSRSRRFPYETSDFDIRSPTLALKWGSGGRGFESRRPDSRNIARNDSRQPRLPFSFSGVLSPTPRRAVDASVDLSRVALIELDDWPANDVSSAAVRSI